jgi:beta-lactamase class A
MLPIEEFISRFSDRTVALSVCDLETGREIHVNADASMHPASTIKVPVMMEVFRQAEAGTLSLADQIPITNAFTSIHDGTAFSLDADDDSDKSLYACIGRTESIRELTRLMIVRSSNLATNLLIDRLSVRQVNDHLRQLGISDVTVLRGVEDKAAFRAGLNNRATARGLTQLMKCIAGEKVVSKTASQEMIRIMLGQEFNESIPALLPASARVAHKTGWTDDFRHDTGIVFAGDRKPYAISIMTHGFPEHDETQAHNCMAEISRLVYEELVAPAR